MRTSPYADRRPGVFIERADATRVPPVVLRTDIAAFVGIAEQGPLDTPVPIESVSQFSAHFGDFIGTGYLAYAVRAFFDNGGRRCWVVRVASRVFDADAGRLDGASSAALELADLDGHAALRLCASSAGAWGNRLSAQWSPSGAAIAEAAPGRSTRQYAQVASVAGFAADDLVRIEQAGRAPVYRVVAAVVASVEAPVNGGESRIYFVHPDAVRRRPTDQPLSDVDPLLPLRILRIAYALTLRRGATVIASYRDLHLVPAHPRFIGSVLRPTVYWSSTRQVSALVAAQAADAARDGEPGARLPAPPLPCFACSARGLNDPPISNPASIPIPRPLAVPFDRPMALSGGRDGLAALTVADFVGEVLAPQDSDFARRRKSRGLQPLVAIDEIALVAVPDILIQPASVADYLPAPPPAADPCRPCPAPTTARTIHQPQPVGEQPPRFPDQDIGRVQAALIQHCEDAGDRFALLSLPFRLATSPAISREDLVCWRDQFDSRVAALYAPWVEVADPRGVAPTRLIPPCGMAAGAIARTDLTAGVQRAPGNVTVTGVVRVVRAIDDALHGALNAANINLLRADFGQAPLIGGARTLSHDGQWAYLNVVRLLLTIKQAADLVLRWAVFEPNGPLLWANVTSALTAVLALFQQRGAFAGETAAQSFYVVCDETTNPPASREAGQLVALLGFQPATPCEFIVVRVGRQFASPAVSLFAAEEVPA